MGLLMIAEPEEERLNRGHLTGSKVDDNWGVAPVVKGSGEDDGSRKTVAHLWL